MTTEWRPIPGYEGFYEVSSYGSVRSLGRIVTAKTEGVRGFPRRAAPRVLRAGINSAGYEVVTLVSGSRTRTQFPIHHLVTLAFLGPREDGQVVRHLDDIRTNNTLANLAYGSYSDNARDAVRNGRGAVGATVCRNGQHARTSENTIYRASGRGYCRPCENEGQRRRKRLAREGSESVD